jgi:hypothetical protein
VDQGWQLLFPQTLFIWWSLIAAKETMVAGPPKQKKSFFYLGLDELRN